MRAPTRRDALIGAAAATFARPLAAADADGLNAIGSARGLRFGSAVAWSPPNANAGSFANPAYAALIERECGLVVPENEMKWRALRPSPDRFEFGRFDDIMAYAERRGLAVRGHNLLWHQPKWFPAWLNSYDFGSSPRVEGERVLITHISTVLRRYGARIGGYDVVNEAVRPADGALYDTSLSKAIGGVEPTLDLAFRTARAEAPHAQLVYNDYMNWEPGGDAHRASVLRLLEGFRRRGTPIDALGVQSHLATHPPGTPVGPQQATWRRFLDAVTGMGFKLLVTELDVRDNGLPADVDVRDRGVADYTRAYLDVTLSYPGLRDVLCWGLCDRYSWIEGVDPRKDGARRRPTPYDTQFRAKPMRSSVAAALRAAAAR